MTQYVFLILCVTSEFLYVNYALQCVIGTSALYNRYSLLNLFASINNCQYFKAFMRCECWFS